MLVAIIPIRNDPLARSLRVDEWSRWMPATAQMGAAFDFGRAMRTPSKTARWS